MNRNDIDFTPFPNCGNNPFYMNEFNIANMLPTVPVSGPAITKALNTNDIDAINEILMNNSIISEKKVERKNDKGEDVPEKCPKCGSPVKLVFKGEPVWVCSNKDCNEYFGTLPFNESVNESVLKSDSDIYWNKDKFDSGEINLCFITGLSGSGKSSMAHSQESDKIEVYELDDLVYTKDHFTMDNLKEYGDLIYTFFKKHPEYYLTQKECEDQDIPTEKYEDKIFPDFISHAMQYAKSHKNKKFILEGIWLYVYSKPEQLKDYAVYIKGTSVLKSKIRASKRDSKNEANNKLDRARRFISQSTSHWKHFIKSDNTLDTWRNYFIKQMESMNESVGSHTNKFLLQYMAETAKRSELPDSVFGIPEERKYPMPDKKHVISAIKLFGHVDKKYEEELAKRIIKNIRKYDIDVSFVTKNNKLYKYLLDSHLVKESVSLYDQFFLSPC